MADPWGDAAQPGTLLKADPGEEVYCKICHREIGRATVGYPPRREWVHVHSGLRHCHPVATPALRHDLAPGGAWTHRTAESLLERERLIEDGQED